MSMSKAELLEILNGIRATIVLGYVVGRYADGHTAAIKKTLRGQKFAISTGQDAGRADYDLSLDIVADFFEDTPTRKAMLGNLYLLMKQDLIRLAYEHIAHYCEEHNCYDDMRKQSWWMFARIIRYTISHKTGAVLHRWPPDAPDSVTWKGNRLSMSDLGRELSFDADEAFRLFDEMAAFARWLPG